MTESISVYRKTLLNDEVTGSCSVCTPWARTLLWTAQDQSHIEYSKFNIPIQPIYIIIQYNTYFQILNCICQMPLSSERISLLPFLLV